MPSVSATGRLIVEPANDCSQTCSTGPDVGPFSAGAVRVLPASYRGRGHDSVGGADGAVHDTGPTVTEGSVAGSAVGVAVSVGVYLVVGVSSTGCSVLVGVSDSDESDLFRQPATITVPASARISRRDVSMVEGIVSYFGFP